MDLIVSKTSFLSLFAKIGIQIRSIHCFFFKSLLFHAVNLFIREIRLSVLVTCPKFDLLLPVILFILTYRNTYILHTGSLIRFRFSLGGGQKYFMEPHIRKVMTYGYLTGSDASAD